MSEPNEPQNGLGAELRGRIAETLFRLLRLLDEEYRRELLELAMTEVRDRVQPHTFEAWRMMSLDNVSGAATADALNMSTGAVFVAKSRVDRLMSETVRRLDADPQATT